MQPVDPLFMDVAPGHFMTRNNQRGAALLLMLSVLGISTAALLMRTYSSPSPVLREQQQRAKSLPLLSDASEAVRGFTAARGRVPCPATVAGGAESPLGGGVCTAASGFLPVLTLGVVALDAWNRPIRYAVATSFFAPLSVTDHPYSATTTSGLPAAGYAPSWTTNLHICSPAPSYAYGLAGAGACPVGATTTANLLVAIWSDGADTSSLLDNVAIWPTTLQIMAMLSAGGF